MFGEEPDPEFAQDTLARTMWGEARNQGNIGMQAVANVVMNRVANPSWWGDDVISVCKKPYQFSCWNESDPNLPKLMAVTFDDPQFAEASIIAGNAISGNLPDITGGADSYCVIGTDPAWARNIQPTATIGKHEFYKTVNTTTA